MPIGPTAPGSAGGSTPAGSGSEIQYRAAADALGAVAGSSVAGADLTLAGDLTLDSGAGTSTTSPDLTLSARDGAGAAHSAAIRYVGGSYVQVAGAGSSSLILFDNGQAKLAGSTIYLTGTLVNDASGTLLVVPANGGFPALAAQASAGQSANVFEVRDSSGTPKVYVTAANALVAAVRAAAINAATDGATVTFDLALADTHSVTLGGNRALALSNAPTASPWRRFTIILTQDATGSRTIASYWSGITWMTADGNPPSLAAAAGKATVLVFLQTGSGAYLGFLAGSQA